MPAFYGEYDPAAELRPLLAAYWVFRVDGALPSDFEHSVPPDGAVSFFHSRRMGRAMALGPRTEPLRPPVEEGDVVHGVRLWPGAARVVLQADVTRLRNTIVPLEVVMPGEWARRFGEALAGDPPDDVAVRRLDQVWAPLVARRADLDLPVMRAVFAIVESHGRTPVSRLAAEAGLSERHLRRRFVEAVGLSPKELSRVRRMRASVVEAFGSPQRRWVELAAACGYADQAHLVREYKRLSGLAPEAFLAHLERIRHGQVKP